jgi:Ni,Fe-hydrogenase III small subunit
MLRILKQSLRTGIVTEAAPLVDDAELERIGVVLRRRIGERFGRSLAIRQVDAGSCNGCELEIHALNNPYYDVERFGVHFVASPRHADALLVTGPVSRHMETALRRTWRATPSPKLVIAAGTCACTGGEFGVSYASCGAVENVIPVDVRIPGCPPTPLDLLKGLLGAIRARTGAAG